jgi:hypothetical protein
MRYHRTRSVDCSAVCRRRAKKPVMRRTGWRARFGRGDRGLSGILNQTADRLEQQRPAGDGLAVPVGIGQADEQVPPVAHQRDHAGL